MPTDATEEEAAVGLLVLNSGSSRDTASTVPLKRKSLAPEPEPPAADTITCICGFAYDDGFSIGCDSCSRWCHAACFDIVDSQIPEEWECWVCRPRAVDREHAVMIQRARQRAAVVHSQADKPKRRVSSGIERKRRPSVAATADGGKRKQRRSSVNTHHTEDEHVDIDEPWTLSYVSIDKDIVPSDDTRDKLRRVATHWRGVTALESNAIPPTPPIGLAQLPLSSLSHPSIFSHTNLSVRPPSYAIHASQPIPSTNFISPFTSTVIPSTAYLSDPLNAYAHLGMPKPFVHLLGPPLDVALDARFTGDQARFVRSGCRPNAVLRPMICRGEDSTLRFGIFALRDVKAHEEVVLGWEWDDGNVIHHLPALIESPHTFPPRQIDYFRLQMTSMLHALSSTFTTCACGASASDCALNRMAAFVDGQTPPTPSPSPPTNFDTNFSGPHAVFEHHRAVSEVRERENADSRGLKVDLGPLIGVERGFRTRERVPRAGGIGGVEMVPPSPSQADCTFEQSASPSTVVSDEVHTNERRETSNTPRRVPVPEAAETSRITKTTPKDRKGKGKATDEEVTVNEDYERPRRDRRRVTIDPASISPTSGRFRSPNAMDVDRDEMLLPPRMRKAWIHKSFEALRNSIAHDAHVRGDMGSSSGTGDGEGQAQADSMEVDDSSADSIQMPPPPPPAPSTPTTPAISVQLPQTPACDERVSISPSIPFANLSLRSPVPRGPPPAVLHRRSSSPSPLTTNIPPTADARIESAPIAHVQPQDDALAFTPSISRREHSPPAVSTVAAPTLHHVREHEESSQDFLPFWREPSPVHYYGSWTHAAGVESAPQRSPSNLLDSFACGASLPSVPAPGLSYATCDRPVTKDVPTPSSIVSPPPPPPPPPPPKVKLSLKDFMLRKKKQREEEMRVSQSPQIPVTPLAELVVANNTSSVTDERPAHTENVVVSEKPPASIHVPSAVRIEQQERQPVSESLPAGDSFQAKVEILETVLPSEPPADAARNSVDHALASRLPPPEPPPTSSQDQEHSNPPISDTPLSPTSSSVRSRSSSRHCSHFLSSTPTSPLDLKAPLSRSRTNSHRQTSPGEEDGEILSPPPPKAPPLAPRSHTPPMHPRSFQTVSNANPVRPPLHPSQHRPQQNAYASTALRPLPSGPRALRAGNSNAGLPSAPLSTRAPAVHVPRGPSTDRERERDRDRGRSEWDRERNWISARGRGRSSGGIWGR